MKLTRFTDYALRVLIFVGVRGDGRVTIREISEAYGISRHHLMKVVSDLVRLGYLDAQRGPGGGIKLSRPAGEIGLASVVLDMEEDMDIVSCFEGEGKCVIQTACRLREALNAALAAFLGTLRDYTLQDLIAPNKALARILHIS